MDEVEKVDKTLWRTENLTLPSGIKYAVMICGTKNIDYINASSIANGLLCVVLNWFQITPTSYKLSHTTQELY